AGRGAACGVRLVQEAGRAVRGAERGRLPLGVGEEPLPGVAARRGGLKPGDQARREDSGDRDGVESHAVAPGVRASGAVVVVVALGAARRRGREVLRLLDLPAPDLLDRLLVGGLPDARLVLVIAVRPRQARIRRVTRI